MRRIAFGILAAAIAIAALAAAQNATNLEQVAGTQYQLTGVAVSQDGRIFVNFPRWVDNITMTVPEVQPDGSVTPYPNAGINMWMPSMNASDHLVSVQSVYIDSNNTLWIVDPAAPQFAGPVPGGPKLLEVDLKSNTVSRTYNFNQSIAPKKSYLNDIRVDPGRGYAYLTESGLGAIIVLDLKTGQARRMLSSDASTRAETVMLVVQVHPVRYVNGSMPIFNADGIALDRNGEYLYYHALTGRTLYRIPTAYLRNFSVSDSEIASRVEKLGEDCATDGMIMDNTSNLYLTCVEKSAVQSRSFEGSSASSSALRTVAQDPRLMWPDSFSIQDGYLYLTASQFHLMPQINNGTDMRKPPYMIFRIRVG